MDDRDDAAHPPALSAEPEFVRSPGTVWRLTSDRVLVRRVDSAGLGAELLGPAALVWVAAEVPSTTNALQSDTGLSEADVRRGLDELSTHGWIVET